MGTKISELTEVTTPDGADVLPIVSGGETKKVTVTNLLGGMLAEQSDGSVVNAGVLLRPADASQWFQLFGGDYSAAPGSQYIQIAIVPGSPTLLTIVGATAGGAYVELDIGSDGSVSFYGLPTSDPGVAGQVYSDGVPSAGVPQALKISGG